jgi:hypothetical protein
LPGEKNNSGRVGMGISVGEVLEINTVKELHDKAMLLLQDAIVSRYSGDDSTADKKYKKAFKLESKAADLVSQKPNCEPTRSILFGSAASLAYQAGDYENSLILADKCLSGNPPNKIGNEIKSLYENIFERGLAGIAK